MGKYTLVLFFLHSDKFCFMFLGSLTFAREKHREKNDY